VSTRGGESSSAAEKRHRGGRSLRLLYLQLCSGQDAEKKIADVIYSNACRFIVTPMLICVDYMTNEFRIFIRGLVYR
jgi:hypothetical protein